MQHVPALAGGLDGCTMFSSERGTDHLVQGLDGLGQQLNSGKNAFHPANTGGERSRL